MIMKNEMMLKNEIKKSLQIKSPATLHAPNSIYMYYETRHISQTMSNHNEIEIEQLQNAIKKSFLIRPSRNHYE